MVVVFVITKMFWISFEAIPEQNNTKSWFSNILNWLKRFELLTFCFELLTFNQLRAQYTELFQSTVKYYPQITTMWLIKNFLNMLPSWTSSTFWSSAWNFVVHIGNSGLYTLQRVCAHVAR